MISVNEYFGRWVHDAPDEHLKNARNLLEAVGKLIGYLIGQGITFPYNPNTHTLISGRQYGGYRPQSCPEGAPQSAHKQALAVDLYDPQGDIDDYLLADYESSQDAGKPSILERYGIYIEHPSKTISWSHWSIRAPKSGNRVFYP